MRKHFYKSFDSDDSISYESCKNKIGEINKNNQFNLKCVDKPKSSNCIKKIKCKRGPRGHKGKKGIKGRKGCRGKQGPTGNEGPTGPCGYKGDTGPCGDKGDKGDKGDIGDIGNIGPQGNDGPQGNEGTQGDDGPTGSIGPQGNEGDDGPTGPQGDEGDDGPTGPQGNEGDDGPTGPQGADGATGPQGNEGPTGLSVTQLFFSGTSLFQIPQDATTTVPNYTINLEGSDFNSVTGVYTVPENGVYHMEAHVNLTEASIGGLSVSIVSNLSGILRNVPQVPNDLSYLYVYVVKSLTLGEQITLTTFNPDNINYPSDILFSGNKWN